MNKRTVIIGEHYTFDNGEPYETLIMFVTEKAKYVNEDVHYFDTISLNPFGVVFEKDFETDFFQSEHIRLSTIDEIKKIRSSCPVDSVWLKMKTEEIINKYWDINIRPNIILDRDEPLERQYFGVYDTNLQAILFRSEFLALIDIERIEKTLTHELCHWFLHVTNQEYKDEDVRFAQEIMRIGAEDTINTNNKKAKEAFECALKMKIK